MDQMTDDIKLIKKFAWLPVNTTRGTVWFNHYYEVMVKTYSDGDFVWILRGFLKNKEDLDNITQF